MNKYQEALDYLSKNCLVDEGDYDYEDNYETWYVPSGEEETKILQELIDEKEKYRWHDLRKDPNDLPVVGEKVLCATGNKGGREVQIYRGSHLNSQGESVWDWKHNSVKLPIAWKYIEELDNE